MQVPRIKKITLNMGSARRRRTRILDRLVTTGFVRQSVRSWPRRCPDFLSCVVSPTPMLSVILFDPRTCIEVLYPNFFINSGTTSLRSSPAVWPYQASTISPFDLKTRTLRPSCISLIRSVGLFGLGIEQRDVGDVDGMSLSTMPRSVLHGVGR